MSASDNHYQTHYGDIPDLIDDDSSYESDVEETTPTVEAPKVEQPKPVFDPSEWADDYDMGTDARDDILHDNPAINQQLTEIGQMGLSPGDLMQALCMWAASMNADNDDDIDNIDDTQ